MQPWTRWGGYPSESFLTSRAGSRGNGYNACPLLYAAYQTTGLSLGYPTIRARKGVSIASKARFVFIKALNAYINVDELRSQRNEVIVVCFWKGTSAPSGDYKDYSEATAPIEYILVPSVK